MRLIDFNKLIFWTPMIILLAFFAFAIIKLTIASPAVPNPGHSYSEVEFPSGIVFTPAGQLGIGATTPSSLLHINRSSDAIADISLSRSGSGNIWGLYRYGSSGSDRFCIGIFGTNEPFCITTAGSVGIGTTNPGNYKLNVIGDINASWVNVTRGIRFPDGSLQTTAGGGGGGGLAIFGDGSDGPGVISSNYFLPRDMFYSSLTVNSGATLNTNGYRIFVRGTLTNNGVISRVGNPGQNGNFGASASGGAALSNATSSLGGSEAGGYAQLLSAINGGSLGNSLGGTGGYGGSGSGSSGGGGGVASAPTALQGGYRSLPSASVLRLVSAPWAFVAGGGGGGGGGSSAVPGPIYVSGGGGGSGGGVMVISANVIVNNGAIQANGGAGGNAYAGGNPGGGGGGGGGVIVLIYNSYSGTGTKTVTGGAGGTGFGTGTNGLTGYAGTLIEIPNA